MGELQAYVGIGLFLPDHSEYAADLDYVNHTAAYNRVCAFINTQQQMVPGKIPFKKSLLFSQPGNAGNDWPVIRSIVLLSGRGGEQHHQHIRTAGCGFPE